jgi:hypothetical protein
MSKRFPAMNRMVLAVVLVLVFGGPVVSGLASPGVGRASEALVGMTLLPWWRVGSGSLSWMCRLRR